MTPQAWPLVARTTDYREWWVLGWEDHPDGDALVPVVVPRAAYGLEAATTQVVGPDGARVTQYADPPARPRRLDLPLIVAWIAGPDLEPPAA